MGRVTYGGQCVDCNPSVDGCDLHGRLAPHEAYKVGPQCCLLVRLRTKWNGSIVLSQPDRLFSLSPEFSPGGNLIVMDCWLNVQRLMMKLEEAGDGLIICDPLPYPREENSLDDLGPMQRQDERLAGNIPDPPRVFPKMPFRLTQIGYFGFCSQ